MNGHFEGKQALEHLIDARLKGLKVSQEIHGVELPGHYSAAADAAKETAILLLILWILFIPDMNPTMSIHWKKFLILFTSGWLIWKVGRSAILGWSRLERVHRLIEEERWEIEHHREQEREELRALYEAKGFSGKLLAEAVDVTMADDHRLLLVMLTEELGLSLESIEHPLKQAAGAAVGVAGATLIFSFGLFYLPFWGAAACSALVIFLSAGTTAQMAKNRLIHAIIWNLSVAALASAVAYFLTKLIRPLA